jgi:LacI family transcriptional regulator
MAGVVGFANEQIGEHITPGLSTVDQQTIQMGKAAFELLMERIDGPDQKRKAGKKWVLEPKLIERDSSNK